MLISIDPKALEHACQCAGRSVHHFDRMGDDLPLRASIIAHARAIEQHEAYKQEVSDAVAEIAKAWGTADPAWGYLRRFIIAKPDPLVEAVDELWTQDRDKAKYMADQLHKYLAARGLEVRKIGEGE